jgi:hypothetical protein
MMLMERSRNIVDKEMGFREQEIIGISYEIELLA